MRAEQIRVSVRLAPHCDADAFLAAAEEALGHPVQLAQRLRGVPVLSLWLHSDELETIQSLPGVGRAVREGRSQIPPKPLSPRRERE